MTYTSGCLVKWKPLQVVIGMPRQVEASPGRHRWMLVNNDMPRQLGLFGPLSDNAGPIFIGTQWLRAHDYLECSDAASIQVETQGPQLCTLRPPALIMM